MDDMMGALYNLAVDRGARCTILWATGYGDGDGLEGYGDGNGGGVAPCKYYALCSPIGFGNGDVALTDQAYLNGDGISDPGAYSP